MPSFLPTPSEIRAAATRIAALVTRTPLRRSDSLSDLAGGDVYLKLESEQATGSFKIRGATNALALLATPAREAGVVTASAGNHGLGTAAAAKALGINATIFVPRTAPAIKRDHIVELGATIDASAPNYDAAEVLAREYAARTGATYVSPCSGRDLLAGQGTVALEILEQLPSVRTVIVPVGGAGLAGGVAGMLRGEAPLVHIIGAQSERTNAMTLALASGKPAEIPDRPTLADGLAGLADAEMLAQGKAALDEIVTVSERAIGDAIAGLWVEDGVRAEGAGAVGVAALLAGVVTELEFPVVVIVSGGNIDATRHAAILDGTFNYG